MCTISSMQVVINSKNFKQKDALYFIDLQGMVYIDSCARRFLCKKAVTYGKYLLVCLLPNKIFIQGLGDIIHCKSEFTIYREREVDIPNDPLNRTTTTSLKHNI